MATVVPRRQLYLTALSILFIVLLLLVFISISTYHNLNRERNAAMETVRRQALTLINALEAGVRAGMMQQMAGEDTIGNLVHEIGGSDDINYLYLVNADGQVVHHSIPSVEGTRALWRPTFTRAEDVRTRVRLLPDGSRVFEVAKPFTPMGMHLPGTLAAAAAPTANTAVHFHTRATVYLGMSMRTYETARRSDLQHAFIMGGIVVALGGGVIYFFIVLRSYYHLSRTLQKTRDYTRQVIASMAHGVLSIDAAGTVVSHNRQALRLLGIPPAAIEGLDLRTIIDFDDTGISQTLNQGIPVLNHEFDHRRRSGDILPLLLTVTPIRDDAGTRRGAVVVIRDMRTIKQLEAQVRRTEKLAAIGRLAAGVAHEIRNPLSSIRGFAYLLGRGHAEQTPEREYADVMVREIDRINHVVTDLLNFARPMSLELEAVDLGNLIDHVVSLVSADATGQGIDIRVDIAADLPAFRLDPNQATQALLNLMLNAIKALDTGGTITIHATICHDGQAVCIQVEDNGPGIAADLQDKIFEPFYTTRQQGTGLGLAMVRKIAEQHAGEISVDSPPPAKQKGTRFTLRLKDMQS